MPDLNEDVVLVPLGTRTATGGGADYTNPDAIGAVFYLEITAVTGSSPTLNLKLQAKDPASGQYHDVAAYSQKNTTGRDMLIVYPGLTELANKKVDYRLPRTFRFHWTIGGTGSPSFTFSIGASLLRGGSV